MKLRQLIKDKRVIAIVLAVGTCLMLIFAKPTNQPCTSYSPLKGETVSMKTTVYINGKEYTGTKMQVKATAYTSAPDEGGPIAYNGERLRDGHIAADIKVLPLGTKVYIPKLNKVYTVVDTGSAIKGNRIDIWMKTKQQMKQWGVQDIDIIVLD